MYVALLLGLEEVEGDPLGDDEDEIEGVDDGLLEVDGELLEETVVVGVIDGLFVDVVVGETLDVLETLGLLVDVLLGEAVDETDPLLDILYDDDPVLLTVLVMVGVCETEPDVEPLLDEEGEDEPLLLVLGLTL